MIPPFLTDYLPARGISSVNASRLQNVLTNWLKTHEHIKSLQPSNEAVRELALMMFVEYYRKEGPRMDIIVRLHGRFNKLRYEVERVELGNRKRR